MAEKFPPRRRASSADIQKLSGEIWASLNVFRKLPKKCKQVVKCLFPGISQICFNLQATFQRCWSSPRARPHNSPAISSGPPRTSPNLLGGLVVLRHLCVLEHPPGNLFPIFSDSSHLAPRHIFLPGVELTAPPKEREACARSGRNCATSRVRARPE